METAESGQIVLIITHLPDENSAIAMAEMLIGERLAACVNIYPACRSVYRWQGKTEQAQEFPLVIKAAASRYAKVEKAVRAHHPYELPDILAVPVSAGLPEYLSWVANETTAE